MEFTMGGHPVDPGHKRGNPFGAKRDKLELDLLSEDCAAFKLNGIPDIVYRNSSDDKRKYMEDQFSSWNISNYKRHSNKYLVEDYDDWKHLVDDLSLIHI